MGMEEILRRLRNVIASAKMEEGEVLLERAMDTYQALKQEKSEDDTELQSQADDWTIIVKKDGSLQVNKKAIKHE